MGIDVGAEKLEVVKSLGADYALSPDEAPEVVMNELGGVDASIAFTAKLAGFRLGLQLLKRGGLFVAVGLSYVTFFFSGGREDPFPGEQRLLVPSPKVATYDLCPEMSAGKVTTGSDADSGAGSGLGAETEGESGDAPHWPNCWPKRRS